MTKANNMLTVEEFEKAASQAEPAATFAVMQFMCRARDFAISERHAGRERVSGAEVLAAMHVVFPEIWHAWRAWAGPGSECIDFEVFKPCHHIVLEFFMTLWTGTDGGQVPASELTAFIRAECPSRYATWSREDRACIVRAIRRHVDAGLFAFDGMHVSGGPALTLDYMRAYSDAYRVEGERMKAEADVFQRVNDLLAATGCDTEAEYRERFGQEPS